MNFAATSFFWLIKLSSCLLLQLLPNSCCCWVVKQRKTLVTKICCILKYKTNKIEPNWPGWGVNYLNLQNQGLRFWIIVSGYADNVGCKFLFSPFWGPLVLSHLLHWLSFSTYWTGKQFLQPQLNRYVHTSQSFWLLCYPSKCFMWNSNAIANWIS